VGIVRRNNINMFIGNCLLMASSVNTELENLKAVFLIKKCLFSVLILMSFIMNVNYVVICLMCFLFRKYDGGKRVRHNV
jgi:hypothetical protein